MQSLGTIAGLLDYGRKIGDNQAGARTAAKLGREDGRLVINGFGAVRALNKHQGPGWMGTIWEKDGDGN